MVKMARVAHVIAKRLNGSNAEITQGESEGYLFVETEEGSQESIDIATFRKRHLKGVFIDGVKIDVWADEALMLLHSQAPSSSFGGGGKEQIIKIAETAFDDFDFEADMIARSLIEQIVGALQFDITQVSDVRKRKLENALSKALKSKVGSILTSIKDGVAK